MKRCTRCGETKPLPDFLKDNRKQDGHASCCRACFNDKQRRRRAAEAGLSPEEFDLRRWYRENSAKWRAKHPGRFRNWYLMHQFGLTVEGYDEILTRQGGRCGNRGCGVELDSLPSRDVHVDHDHETGGVRGILCRECNLAQGHVRDSTARLRGLADYLDAAKQLWFFED